MSPSSSHDQDWLGTEKGDGYRTVGRDERCVHTISNRLARYFLVIACSIDATHCGGKLGAFFLASGYRYVRGIGGIFVCPGSRRTSRVYSSVIIQLDSAVVSMNISRRVARSSSHVRSTGATTGNEIARRIYLPAQHLEHQYSRPRCFHPDGRRLVICFVSPQPAQAIDFGSTVVFSINGAALAQWDTLSNLVSELCVWRLVGNASGNKSLV